MTPKRPDATCLIAERRRSPLASGMKRSASSPPSPVFDLPPMRFIAMARVSCASLEIEPYDIAPVAKRLTISLDRLDLVDRHRRRARRRGARTARAAWPGCVDWSSTSVGVLLEDVVALGARRVLQLEHRLRVEEVVLALAAPLVLAAELEVAVGALARAASGSATAWRRGDLVGELVEADAAEAATRCR